MRECYDQNPKSMSYFMALMEMEDIEIVDLIYNRELISIKRIKKHLKSISLPEKQKIEFAQEIGIRKASA